MKIYLWKYFVLRLFCLAHKQNGLYNVYISRNSVWTNRTAKWSNKLCFFVVVVVGSFHSSNTPMPPFVGLKPYDISFFFPTVIYAFRWTFEHSNDIWLWLCCSMQWNVHPMYVCVCVFVCELHVAKNALWINSSPDVITCWKLVRKHLSWQLQSNLSQLDDLTVKSYESTNFWWAFSANVSWQPKMVYVWLLLA